MTGSLHQTARAVSVIAGTLVALSCGTNVRASMIPGLPARIGPDDFIVCVLGMGAAVCAPDETLVDRE